MELRTFLVTLRRLWVIPALTLLVALSGVLTYHKLTDQPQAASTVAVLDPLAARGTINGEAQIDFSDVVQSHQLAVLVAKQLGTTPDAVTSKVQVRVLPPPAGAVTNASLVYSVSAQAKTPADAIRLDNAVIDQATKLYVQLNTPDPKAFEQALAPQFTSAQNAIDDAQAKLDSFTKANDAADLPSQVQQQRANVGQLQISVSQAQADLAAAKAANVDASLVQAATRKEASLQASLTAAEEQLSTQTDLESQYQSLLDQVNQAKQVMQGLVLAEQAYVGADRPPYANEVKVLDAAQPQSQALILLLTYLVGVVLGLLVGMSIVYLVAVFHRPEQTSLEVGRAFGAPVLVRIPSLEA
ncbi:MAG TPA: hypothetical protein VG015_08985 [Candidatus Dormibacteraeota bacterium]|jgi:uncharacterized protein involved in exopolysaccharide biosynthesis|nr:hypothetical protein [Candidatus Dormibacteraeota bacterium]